MREKPLLSGLRKYWIATSLAAACAAAVSLTVVSDGWAGGETRTLSLVQVHTGEKLTVTYMKNGRYIPSAMARINHLLRDWRRNKVTTIDPRTIDLMWELYADLGSKVPIRIISGYRSPETNGMLKRIGRKVATKSQHTAGRAIDMFFPDVPLSRLRNSAIVREVGGVGYYPAGSGGFVHIDSGSVRYWPRPSDSQIAQIFRQYKSTVGARLRGGDTQFAMREVPSTDEPATGKKPASALNMVASLFSDEADEGQTPVAPAANPPPMPRAKPVLATAAADITLPRERPASLVAAAAPTITPAAAKPQTPVAPLPRPQQIASLSPVPLRADDEAGVQSNANAKGGMIETAQPAPRVLTASLDTEAMELRGMLEQLQDQDERDDELQQASTKGGPVSNVMAKSDRLVPGDGDSLRVHRAAMSDPLFDAAKPLPFPVD